MGLVGLKRKKGRSMGEGWGQEQELLKACASLGNLLAWRFPCYFPSLTPPLAPSRALPRAPRFWRAFSGAVLVSGPQRGPAERGHVKKRRKSSKSVKNIFDIFRAGQKKVKNRQKVSKYFSTFFHRPFSGGSDLEFPHFRPVSQARKFPMQAIAATPL